MGSGAGLDKQVTLRGEGAPAEIEVIQGPNTTGVRSVLTTEDAFVLGLNLLRAAGRTSRIVNVKPIEVE